MNKFIELKYFNIGDTKYKLYKSYNFKFADIKRLDKKFNIQVETSINDFLKVMLSIFKEEDLPLLFSNLKTLSVKKYKLNDYIFLKNFDAYYSSNVNTITIHKNKLNVIYHELFHMASSFYNKDNQMIFTGFEQNNLFKKGIGKALNEGYTQILTERYFSEKLENVYNIEKSFAQVIEMIVGKEKMQSLYFRADLPGLINEFQNYCNNDEIIKLLNDLDILSKYSNKEKIKNVNDPQILINSYKSAYLILMKCYAHNFVLNNDQLTNELLYNSFTLFLKHLGDNLVINDVNIQIFTQEELARLFYFYCNEAKSRNMHTNIK